MPPNLFNLPGLPLPEDPILASHEGTVVDHELRAAPRGRTRAIQAKRGPRDDLVEDITLLDGKTGTRHFPTLPQSTVTGGKVRYASHRFLRGKALLLAIRGADAEDLVIGELPFVIEDA